METKEVMTIKGVSFLLLKGLNLQHIKTVTAQTDIYNPQSTQNQINYEWLCEVRNILTTKRHFLLFSMTLSAFCFEGDILYPFYKI